MSEIKLTADGGGGSVSLKGPATTTGNSGINVILPKASIDLSSAGTNGQFLKTDGAGTLSFATVDTSIANDSIVEAKLDVSNAPTNGQFLQAQSGEGGGLTWAAGGGINKANIVQIAADTAFSTSSTSYVTNLTGAITPATGSYVMILCEAPETIYRRTGTVTKIYHQIERGTALSGTSLYENSTLWYGFTESSESETANRFYMSWIDTTPGGDGSTAITYSWNVKNNFTYTATASNNYLNQNLTTKGRNMYLIEVK